MSLTDFERAKETFVAEAQSVASESTALAERLAELVRLASGPADELTQLRSDAAAAVQRAASLEAALDSVQAALDAVEEAALNSQLQQLASRSPTRDTQSSSDRLRRAFGSVDRDGNGVIDASELGDLFTSLGYSFDGSELSKMFDKFDTDGNGSISFDEFCDLYTSMP